MLIIDQNLCIHCGKYIMNINFIIVILLSQENISQLKGKMSSNSRECEERNKQLREEREVMLAHFQASVLPYKHAII